MKKAHILFSLSLCAFLVCSCSKTNTNISVVPKPEETQEEEEAVCDHNYIYKGNKEASFYEDGYLEHYECNKCSKYFDLNREEISKESVTFRLPFFEKLNQKEPIYLFGQELTLNYNVQAYEKLVSDSNALITKIDKGSYYSATEANNMINRILDMLSEIAVQYDIAYIVADGSAKSEDYNIKNEIYSAYYSLLDQYYATYVAIAKEGSYNDKFFKGKDQAYINQYIIDHSPSEGGGSTTITTTQKIEMLLNKYKAGQLERYTAYHDYVALAKQLATEKKYSNYLDYAYAQYDREYTVSQAMDLCNYVTTYLTPLANSVRSKLAEAEKDSFVKEGYKSLNRDFFGKNIDLLREYSTKLGEPYSSNFKSFFEGGHYFFSNIYNPNVTGYTTVNPTFGRMIFLSRDYQALSTFVHEFGHYNAGEVFGSSSSLDLLETQSKGNELLLLSYLNKTNLIDNKIAKAYMYSQLASHINEILLGCAINELENYVYTTDFNQEGLENKWVELLNKYGASLGRDKFDYMYQVIINYRGYYISYSVSGIAAIQLYTKAIDNFVDGMIAYKSIYTKDSNDEKFNKSLENAGLYNIFQENAYITISNLIDKI